MEQQTEEDRPRKVQTTGDTEPWRLAVSAYEADPWPRGTVVLHADLKAMMGIPIVEPSRVRGDEYQRHRLLYTGQVERLKAYLLQEHQVLLVSQHAQGYRVVPVEDHVHVTNTDARDQLNSAINTWNSRLHNAPVDQMTDAERRALDDSACRLAAVRNNMRKELRGMAKPPAELPPHEEDGGEKE